MNRRQKEEEKLMWHISICNLPFFTQSINTPVQENLLYLFYEGLDNEEDIDYEFPEMASNLLTGQRSEWANLLTLRANDLTSTGQLLNTHSIQLKHMFTQEQEPKGTLWRTLLASNRVTLMVKSEDAIQMVKCKMSIGFAPDIVFEVVKNIDYRCDWDPMVKNMMMIDHLMDEPTFYYSMPNELNIFPRDFIVTQSHVQNYQGGSTSVIINVTPKSYTQEPTQDYVRGTVIFNGWIIRSTGDEGDSTVSWVSKLDMAGVIPRSIYAKLMKTISRSMRRRIIRECRQFLQYRNRA